MCWTNFLLVLLCNSVVVRGIPEGVLEFRAAAERFQNSVQQQTFQGILVAIEERLRNLDGIYTMQLSETLRTKLDQYHRKLDALDTKLIRLESMVMLNLNKISENISTKNYKDDVARTQTYRKMENMYDGVSHRINYMERKFELAFEKIQNRVDTNLLRLERIEEEMVQRNADIESELSETLSILEESRSGSSNIQPILLNITNKLMDDLTSGFVVQTINTTMYEIIQEFNKTLTERLITIENGTKMNLNMSNWINTEINLFRNEVKDDFNSYANKVADMNTDVWRKNDVAEETLKTIESATNSTRIEVQNGMRAIMVQIGKVSGKGLLTNDKTSLDSLKKSIDYSLDKIITNQDLFLESCHRVQADESQIESEISVMLGKLIDMLEKKMTTVMKDLKNIDKAVKSHDARTNRNLNQANINIVSLFEKTTRIAEFAEKDLQDIKLYVNSLFTLVQDVLPKGNESHEYKVLLNNMTHIMKLINNTSLQCSQIENNLLKTDEIKKALESVSLNEVESQEKLAKIIEESLKPMRQKIDQLLQKTLTNQTEVSSTVNPKKNCTSNYGNLINIRSENDCGDTETNSEVPSEQDQFKRTLLDIFGTPPPRSSTTEKTIKPIKSNKKKCLPTWANQINVRFDNENYVNCSRSEKKKVKKQKPKIKVLARFDSEEDTENVTENQSKLEVDYNEEEVADLSTENADTVTTDISSMDNVETTTSDVF